MTAPMAGFLKNCCAQKDMAIPPYPSYDNHGISFLSTWNFRIIANSADKHLAKTVLHQIMICPPNKGGRISISTNINSGSMKVK